MSIEQEIRNEIDNIKQLKIDVGDINNHLNALEGLCRDRNQKVVDDAYQHGYDKGYKDKTNNDEVCKELASEAYQRGLNDAWEAARKIIEMPDPPYWGVFGEYKSDLFGKITASEAIEKLKAYEEKQKAADEIKVGDEVISLDRKGKAIEEMSPWFVTYETKYSYQGFDTDGSFRSNPKESVRKTGRHFNIDKILKEMQQC